MKKAGIVMGSASDLPIVEKTVETLVSLEIPHEVHVYSAHRTPEEAAAFAEKAEENGFGVLIAAAGMAAHLAGVLASKTVLPVIGLPLSSQKSDGIDALLSTVQMPSGIPVATVAIDGAVNAALLSAEILSVGEPVLRERIRALRKSNTEKVLLKNREIEERFNR